MQIAPGVEMLEISSTILGTPSIVHPTLTWDDETVILIDTSFPGQVPLIREAIEKTGVGFNRLNIVILTHQDIDHIGSVASIRKELSKPILVLAHEEEKAYIEGDKQPLKVAQLEANLSTLPAETEVVYQKLKTAFEASTTRVDQTLRDGEELPYCGGITVIHTPGHTIGHICLYLKKSKVLIAGDALEVQEDKLAIPSPSVNHDMEACRHSLKKLTKYEIEAIICHHGGLYRDWPVESISALVQDQRSDAQSTSNNLIG